MLWQLIKKCKCFVLFGIIFLGTQSFTEDTQSFEEIFKHKQLIVSNLENTYLDTYGSKSFFKSQLSDATLEIDNIDLELLNATLFFTLNKKRGSRKKELGINKELINTCESIVKKYSGNSFRRFRSKKNRIRKIAKKYCLQNNFQGTYTDVVVDYSPLLKIRDKQKYIYNNEEQDDDVFFFSKKRKSTAPLKPIAKYTYQSFIETIIKRTGRMNGMTQIRNKGFSEIGCYISIEQKNPKKIPYAKMIWIVGGYRLGLIEEI